MIEDLKLDLNNEKVEKILGLIIKELNTQGMNYSAFCQYFNIHNEDLLDAIKFHCTGKPNMNSIGKIVYSADKADPLRGYDSSKMINLLKSDYNEGFVYTLNENRIFLLNKLYKGESTNNRLSEECFAYYLK